MTYLSDTLTVGLVLVLLFGSISLYLYTRVQQAEQKISLLESILLDLKMSAEIRSYSELPADEHQHVPSSTVSSNALSDTSTSSYQPFSEDDKSSVVESQSDSSQHLPLSEDSSVRVDVLEEENEQSEVDQYKSVVAEAVSESNVSQEQEYELDSKPVTNYESMTLKELQSLAKSRGITGAGTMKKGPIIEALRTSDRSSSVKPGSLSSGSFLETSSSVSDEQLV
jgi:hypothetical protein